MSNTLIIGGDRVAVPLTAVNFLDDPRLKLRVGLADGNNDGRRRRTSWVHLIVLHTTKGIPGGKDQRPQKIIAGNGPNRNKEFDVAKFWSTSDVSSGAHLICDTDGSWGQTADLRDVAAYHANTVNEISIGIEIYQGSDAEIYEGQIESTVKMVDFLTAHFGIQRQIPDLYRHGALDRLVDGGADVVGVVGHRDVTDNRGAGDPGDAIFIALAAAGYERFNFATGYDLDAWKLRQRELPTHVLIADGIPGPATVAGLKAAGRPHGLWARSREEKHLAEAEDTLRSNLKMIIDIVSPFMGEATAKTFLRRLLDE